MHDDLSPLGCSPYPYAVSGQLENGIFLGFPLCLAERKKEGRSDEKHLPCVEFPWSSPAL